MSMDFIYDLKEKLEEQNMEYALCVMKPIKNGDTKVELFYHIENDESFESLCDAMNIVCGGEPGDNVDIEYDSYEENKIKPTPTPDNEDA
tara:strand:- start:524 stop:793 length:270 start_codon:yes stop_codon:yes gene_type:complete